MDQDVGSGTDPLYRLLERGNDASAIPDVKRMIFRLLDLIDHEHTPSENPAHATCFLFQELYIPTALSITDCAQGRALDSNDRMS